MCNFHKAILKMLFELPAQTLQLLHFRHFTCSQSDGSRSDLFTVKSHGHKVKILLLFPTFASET